ncbi:MAG: RNA polymerase sigma factor [Lachnospiraceae bacterium]|nr:RNA polymerase sigma factor [Lachnospiraceae bacterium]
MHWKKKRDEKALLESLYELYEQKMYAAAYAILHQPEQAEDVVHDSFLKLTGYLSRIKEADSQETKRLVMQILKTTAIDLYRKNAKEVERFVSEDIAVTDSKMKVFPIDAVENREIIEKLLKGLSQEYREVIKLRCYYGFSVKETAQILDISCDNVSKRMERARKQLQTKMEWEEYDCEQKKYGLSVDQNGAVGRRKTV